MTHAKIKSDVQTATPGAVVDMWMLDARDQGAGSIIYFTAGTVSGVSNVVHNGITYSPLPIDVDGLEYNAQGETPTPTLTLSNVSKTLQAEVINYNDLLGATLTRRRTFAKYLDGQPEADSSAIWEDEIYIVHRKAVHNKYQIQWEIVPEVAAYGKKIPGRLILRDYCQHVYITTDATNHTCPYDPYDAGDNPSHNYYDEDGNVTTSGNDVCGKRLTDCRLRFGQRGTLPFRGFPAAAKIRV